jgi:cell wall-associated NlpC family hydrolase
VIKLFMPLVEAPLVGDTLTVRDGCARTRAGMHGARPDPQLARLSRGPGHAGAQAGDPGPGQLFWRREGRKVARSRGRAIADEAEAPEWIGTPFVWGQSVKKASAATARGLVAGVFRELGRPEAESFYATFANYRVDRPVPAALLAEGFEKLFDRVETLNPGDIMLLKHAGKPGHMAIFVGGDRAVHAYPGAERRKRQEPRSRGAAPQVSAAQIWRAAMQLRGQARGHGRDRSAAGRPAGEPADQGARLDELTLTTAEYGTPLPRFLGARRFACPVFHAEDLKEVQKTTKVKGGGKQTTYHYLATFACAIADNAIDKVLKIFFDDKLVYDATGAGPISYASSLGVDLNSVMRIYLGTEDQMPDPRYSSWCEDKYGPDSAPAYRGVSYLFFEELPVDNFGNRIPQISVLALDRAGNAGVTLGAIVDAMCDAAGLDRPRHVGADPAGRRLFVDARRREVADGADARHSRRRRAAARLLDPVPAPRIGAGGHFC